LSELDEILAEHSALASAGEGHFTVDPRRQRELLAKLGLQNTAQGFLKLCQGIHRSGAWEVLFRSAKNSLRITFDVPLPETPSDPVHPLGLALLNLSQEYRVDWESCYGGQLRSGHVSPDSFRTDPPRTGEGKPSSTLHITRPSAKWWHRDWTLDVGQTLRRRLVWHQGVYRWNGCDFPEPPPLSIRAQAVVFADVELPGNLVTLSGNKAHNRRLRYRGTVEEQRGGRDHLLASPAHCPAHAILGATRNSWSETFFVLDGVLLEGERNLLDRPGVVAVISADGLTPALSGLELVHDAAFRQRLQGLRPEVSWLDSINQRV
jgi:hypothetical protein